MQNLGGRTALITGAAGGIGRGLAEILAEQGMRLTLVDVEADALAEAADALRRDGATVASVVADVARAADLEQAVETCLDAFGGLDLLCNNAGVGLEGPVESWTDEGWAWVLGVNLMGVVNGVRAAAPVLRRNPHGGHVLNVASIGGLTGAGGHGQYAASKFAVVGLSQSLRDELAPFGVGVTVLCPGFVRSGITTSGRNAPEALKGRQEWLMSGGFEGPAAELFRMIERRVTKGLAPRVVGEVALEAILANELYALTETEFFPDLDRRRRALDRAMEAARRRAGTARERVRDRG